MSFRTLYLGIYRNSPCGKIRLEASFRHNYPSSVEYFEPTAKVVQKTELKFALMCKIRAPKLYWADIATSENTNA